MPFESRVSKWKQSIDLRRRNTTNSHEFSQFRCLCARQSAKANLTHDGSVVEEDGAPFSIVQSSSAAAQLLDDDQRRRQGKKGEMRWESAEVVSFTVSTADGGTPAGLEIANVHTKVLTCIFWLDWGLTMHWLLAAVEVRGESRVMG